MYMTTFRRKVSGRAGSHAAFRKASASPGGDDHAGFSIRKIAERGKVTKRTSMRGPCREAGQSPLRCFTERNIVKGDNFWIVLKKILNFFEDTPDRVENPDKLFIM